MKAPSTTTKIATTLLVVSLFFMRVPQVLAATQSLTGQAGVMNTGGALHFTNYESTVTVESSTGVMSGYGWLDDLGWVAFGTEESNTEGPISVNLTTGALTGKAKVVNTAGYLDFTNFGSNVIMNLDSGDFSGFVWSEDVGWINFGDSGVTTGAAFDLASPVITLDSLTSPTSNASPDVTGSVTDALGTITAVDYQVDSTTGVWRSCTASDGTFDNSIEAFTCVLNMSLADGTHTIYVRATDSDSNTTLVGAEVTVGVTVDTTAPPKDYTTTNPTTGQVIDKTFKPTSLNNLSVVGDTHFPQFCFTRAFDNGSGVAAYTIVVDNKDYLSNIPYTQPLVGDNGDTRQEGDDVIKENSMWRLAYHLYDDVTKQQEVCAYGKQDTHYLETGIHQWLVKAIDNAGNSTSTDTNRFLVMTNQGTYQKPNQSIWFPLSLLQIGNRNNLTNYSTITPTLFTKDTTPLIFSDSTPSLYGIAPVGATIILSLYQDSIDEAGTTSRQQITSQSTIANEASEWGINLDTPLSTGTYYLTLTASDIQDNFAILKDIPLKLTTSQSPEMVLGATIDSSDTAEEQTVTVTEETSVTPFPTPTTKPQSTPTPTPKQFCIPIINWCW